MLPEQSIVWDREHEVELARFGEFNREVVAFEDIPPVLIDATTAIEDASFWENAGFDPIGIAAAGIDSLRGRPRGASTITQQLVRQRLLTNDSSAVTELSASRKLKEIIQSIRVTQAFEGPDGKQRIMAAYLNQNYYGNESYGVAAAAKGYFGKELKDLTLAEAAIIAAIPQAPSAYDLVRNAEEQCVDPNEPEDACTKTQLVVPEDTRIVQRRNQVLDQMSRGRTPLTKDQFTDADFEAAKAEPVVVAPQKSTQWKANHFVWQVREELTAKLCRGRGDVHRDRGGRPRHHEHARLADAADRREVGQGGGHRPAREGPRGGGRGDQDPLPAVDGEPARQEAAQRRAHRAGLPDRRHRRLRRVGRTRTRPRRPSGSSRGSTSSPTAGGSPGRRSSRSSTAPGIAGRADHGRARCSWTS